VWNWQVRGRWMLTNRELTSLYCLAVKRTPVTEEFSACVLCLRRDCHCLARARLVPVPKKRAKSDETCKAESKNSTSHLNLALLLHNFLSRDWMALFQETYPLVVLHFSHAFNTMTASKFKSQRGYDCRYTRRILKLTIVLTTKPWLLSIDVMIIDWSQSSAITQLCMKVTRRERRGGGTKWILQCYQHDSEMIKTSKQIFPVNVI